MAHKLLLVWGLLGLIVFWHFSLESRKPAYYIWIPLLGVMESGCCEGSALLFDYTDNICWSEFLGRINMGWWGTPPHCRVLIGVIITVAYVHTASLSGLLNPTLPNHETLHWFRSAHPGSSRKMNSVDGFWRRLEWTDCLVVVHWLSALSFGGGRELVSA